MSDLQQTTPPQSNEDLISDFFFIVFTPNPAKRKVKIWVDGKITLSLRTEKFLKIIYSLTNEVLKNKVEIECSNYGGFYLIDRQQNNIRKVDVKNEKQLLDLKSAFTLDEKQPELKELYLQSLQNIFDKEARPVKESVTTFDSKYNRVTVYNNAGGFQSYRPY